MKIQRLAEESPDLLDLPKLLDSTESLPFKQSWLPALEPDFMPGEVRLGWTPEFLCGYAVLQDKQFGNLAKLKGDMPWMLGDVFEIFIQRGDRKDYWELHVTPENFQMVLHLPPASEREGLTWKDFVKIYWEEIKGFDSVVWKEEEKGQWRLAWKIPWSIFETAEPETHHWKMAFCRYDYNGSGSKPILSSVCPLTVHWFHQIEDWLDIRLNSDPTSFKI
jgi:hypothetical protein